MKPISVKNKLKGDKVCLVDASLKHMNKSILIGELNSLIRSPKSYFGPLLEVDECKVDLFQLSEKEQVIVAKKMLLQLENENTKSKISLGKQKSINLDQDDFLKISPSNRSLYPKNNKEMKAKPTPKKKGATTPKKKSGVSVAQQKSQAKIKAISNEATKIQREGGKKTIPEKKVFKINRADAVKKAAAKLKRK